MFCNTKYYKCDRDVVHVTQLTSETKEVHDALHVSFARAAILCGSLSASIVTTAATILLEYKIYLGYYDCGFKLFVRF